MSDDALAAVVRLLTFEACFPFPFPFVLLPFVMTLSPFVRGIGNRKEWKIHRNGLQRMVEFMGGLDKLQDNWRLELAVSL